MDCRFSVLDTEHPHRGFFPLVDQIGWQDFNKAEDRLSNKWNTTDEMGDEPCQKDPLTGELISQLP